MTLDGSFEMNTPTTPDWESLANEPLDARDDALMNRIAAMYNEADPVPAHLVDELIFRVSLDALHAELASLVEPEMAMASRGGAVQPTEVKTLTFSSDSLTTMVTISPSGPDRVRIDGWAAPGAGASVELRQGAVSTFATADEDGRFVFEDVPHGLTRFVVRPADTGAHPPVVTPAVEI